LRFKVFLCSSSKRISPSGSRVVCRKMRKGGLSVKYLDLVHFGITIKSWWDSVDVFAASAMSPFILSQKLNTALVFETLEAWSLDTNIWL